MRAIFEVAVDDRAKKDWFWAVFGILGAGSHTMSFEIPPTETMPECSLNPFVVDDAPSELGSIA